MIVRVLDVLQRGRDQQSAAQIRRSAAAEGRGTIQRQMQFRGEPARANMVDAAYEAGVEMARPRAGAETWSSGRRWKSRSCRRCARPIRAPRPRRGRLPPECSPPARRCECVAPAALAALASALHSAPMPPLGCDSPASPAADSAASRYNSVNTVPGERGPKFAPRMASNAEGALERRGIEVLFEQIEDIHAADAQQFAHVAPPQLAHLPADPQQREPVGPVGRTEARRHARQHGRERRGEAPHARLVDRIGLRVRGGEAASRPRFAQVEAGARGPERGGRHALRRPLEPVRLAAAIRAAVPPASNAASARRPRRGSRARTRASTRRRPTWAAASRTSTERPPRASVAAHTSPL